MHASQIERCCAKHLNMLVLKAMAPGTHARIRRCGPHRRDQPGRVPRQCRLNVCCLSAFAQGWTDPRAMIAAGLVTQSLRNPTTATLPLPHMSPW